MYRFKVSNITKIDFDRIVAENDGAPCAVQGKDGLIVIIPTAFLEKFEERDNQWIAKAQLGPDWGKASVNIPMTRNGSMRLRDCWRGGYDTTPAETVRLLRTNQPADEIGRQLAAASRYLNQKTITVKVLAFKQILS